MYYRYENLRGSSIDNRIFAQKTLAYLNNFRNTEKNRLKMYSVDYVEFVKNLDGYLDDRVPSKIFMLIPNLIVASISFARRRNCTWAFDLTVQNGHLGI